VSHPGSFFFWLTEEPSIFADEEAVKPDRGRSVAPSTNAPKASSTARLPQFVALSMVGRWRP
jgi:hypothetical protein